MNVLGKAAAVVATISMTALYGCASNPAPDNKSPQKTEAKEALPRLAEITKQAISRARYADAQSYLQQMFLLAPKDPVAHLLLAELHLATGLTSQAAHEFQQLQKTPKTAARAFQGEGLALLLSGANDKAAKALQEAVKENPALWRAWNGLCYLDDSERKWKQSEECYKSALAANPRAALTYNNRGFSFLLRHRLPEAIRDLQKAAELDPSDTAISRNLRLALAANGEYSRAIAGAGTHLSEALNNVGYVALLRGDYRTAESYLSRAMETDASFNDRAWRNLDYLKVLRSKPDRGSEQKGKSTR